MAQDREIGAMARIAEVLDTLEGKAAERVIRWAADRYGIAVPMAGGKDLRARTQSAEGRADTEYEGLADLFHNANPSTDAERALVAGYWFQNIRGESALDAQRVNTALKHLGYGVKNITSAFTDLMDRMPRLAIQVQKSGKSRQARKKYKLTAEGIREAEQLMSGTDKRTGRGD